MSPILSLVVSCFVALASGTPYLYGVYSTQLISRCGFTALDSSYLSFFTNVGSSLGGVLAGMTVDSLGPQFATGLGAFMEFSGFLILYLSYHFQWHIFPMLLLAMTHIGFGSVLAYFSTLKSSTLNFPKNKGAANAGPVSAYGLAALFYAFVSTLFFADNTEGLLRFIALFSGLVIGIGTFYVKIIPPKESDAEEAAIDDDEEDVPDPTEQDEEHHHTSLPYLLKGHRGSLAAVNLVRNDSSASLFSTVSEASSLASTSSSSLASMSGISGISHPPPAGSLPSPIDMPSADSYPERSSFSRRSAPDNPAAIARGSYHRSATSLLSSSPSPAELKARAVQARHVTPHGTPYGTPRKEDAPLAFEPGFVRSSSGGSYGSTDLSAGPSNLALQLRSGAKPNMSTIASSTLLGKSPGSSGMSSRRDSPSSSHRDSQPATVETPLTFTQPPSSEEEDSSAKYLEMLKKKKEKKHHHHRRHPKHATIKTHIVWLLTNKTFLLYFFLNSFYCSIGQLYIFSVGFIVEAQVNNQNLNPTFAKLLQFVAFNSAEEDLASPYQALQVSIISFANFLGRLIAGPLSDYFAKVLGKSRLYVVIIALTVSALGNLSLLVFDSINLLSLTSLLMGLSYGAIYATMPSILADTFGSHNFATTWALLGTGPIWILLLLSNYFGSYYDSNSQYVDDGKGGLQRVCLKGRGCYDGVFVLTSTVCATLFIGYSLLIRHLNK